MASDELPDCLPPSLHAGAPAPTFHSRFQSEEKATRRAAKAVAKSVNDRLQELEGNFMLGPGPQGVLMVIAIPQRPPATVDES